MTRIVVREGRTVVSPYGIDAARLRGARDTRRPSETLRVGFVGAAAGRFVLEVAEAFRVEHPDCEVQFYEKQFGAGLGKRLFHLGVPGYRVVDGLTLQAQARERFNHGDSP